MNDTQTEPINKVDEIATINNTPILEYLKGCEYWKPGKNNSISCFYKEERTPSMTVNTKTNTLHCFSCGATYSVLDLIIKDYILSEKERNNIKSFNELKPYLSNHENIRKAIKIYKEWGINGMITSEQVTITNKPTSNIDFKEYINRLSNMKEQNKSNIESYFKSRSINYSICGPFTLYDESKNAVIFPYYNFLASQNEDILTGYTERYITEDAIEKYSSKCKHYGNKHIYAITNKYIECSKPIIVVEGETDLLSVYQILFNIKHNNNDNDYMAHVVALSGTTNYKSIIDALKLANKAQDARLIIMLDNDTPGNKATEELAEACKDNYIKYTTKQILPSGFDPNDYLISNAKEMQEKLLDLISNIDTYILNEMKQEEESKKKAIEEKKQSYILNNSAYGLLDSFKEGIKQSVNIKTYKTFFNKLDNSLEGGINDNSLIVIGAGSSIGKTTFILQVADQLAQSKQADILYFSLEMAKEELIAKSISRLTFIKTDDEVEAKTTNEIRKGAKYIAYSNSEKALIEESIKDYSTFAKNIYFIEGIGDIGTNQIKERIKEHIDATGKAPIIFIDYLQLLASPDNKIVSDKQAIDKNIMELKRITRDYKTTIIAISSLNRISYETKVDLSSFKESGAIEYSSDILIGLNLVYDTYDTTSTDKEAIKEAIKEAKSESEREIELEILKNRNGRTGDKIKFTFYAKYNMFMEQMANKETYKNHLEYCTKQSNKINELTFEAWQQRADDLPF